MTGFEIMAQVTLLEIAAIGLRCGAHDCCEIAEVTTHWPGQDGPRCLYHLAGAIRVANAMGFTLATTPLPVKRNDPNPPSDLEVRAGLLELD